MAVSINDVLNRLQGMKKSGSGYMAKCPAHEDKTASLSIAEGEEGRVLFHCHAGCDTQNIAGALGLSMSDLMGEQKPQYSGYEVARYRYGQFEKVRKSDKSFYWTPKLNGADPGLYNAAVLNTFDYVFVVEGEKDVETLKKCGLPAVCSAFGAGNGNKWRREYNALFADKLVYLCPDNDYVGYQFAELERDNIATTAASVQVLDLLAVYPQLQAHGDISDIYAAIGREGTLDLLKKAQKMPPPGKTESDGGLGVHADTQYNNYTTRGANNQPLFAEFMPFEQSEPLKPDGKIHRFRLESDRHGEKSGAYCVWPEGKNYDGKPHGWVQDHHEGGEKHFWQFYSRDNPPPREKPTDEERAAARARREAEERQEAERRREALKSAWSTYQAARSIEEAPDHPYLLAKRVTPRGGFPFGGQWCGLRVGDMTSQGGKQLDNLLFIPMMDVQTGHFCALHRVFGRPGADRKFGKGWCSGAGGVFPIGVDVPGGVVFAGEGIATVLSWYQYWNEESGNVAPCAAIAAMDAGNLIKNAAAIRARYRGRDVFLLQDDDEAGEKAAAACMASGFTGVVNPRDYIR